MIFNYPQGLFLLLLIPLIILLHSIRIRRKNTRVSSLMLWDQVLKSSSRRFQLKRILKNLSLLLQILAALLLILALCRPGFFSRPSETRHLILILDTSASMKSRWNGKSRMDEAKGLALDALGDLSEDSKALLIEAGARPELKTAFTADIESVRGAVRKSRATDEPGSMRDAFLMALSLADSERGDEVWIISDGAFESFEEIELAGIRVNYLQAGGEGENLGITRFQFRSLPDRLEEYEILLAVNNYTSREVVAPLILSIDSLPYISTEVRLQPMEDKTLIFPYAGLIAETAEAEIRVKDDLNTDNKAYAVLSQSRGIRILLITDGNPFLEAVLELYPNARIDRNIPSLDYADYDMVVFDRISPPPLVRGNFLLIDASAPEIPIRKGEGIQNPHVSSWDRGHPVLDSLSLNGVTIARADKIYVGEGVKILVSSRETPLMAAYESSGIRLVYIGFDLLQSDLPLRTAFPMLIGNILRWFYPGSLTSATRQVQAGASYPIIPREIKLDIIDPNGRKTTIYTEESPYLFDKTETVGIYTVKGQSTEESFAVNLSSREESNIHPRFRWKPENNIDSEEAAVLARLSRPLGFIFILLTLLVLLIEWFYWVKKW